jgi:hypothetical protein
MQGYIYTMAAGADPGHGWILNDPIFGRVPTLGACVPNIRRVVQEGDYIFVVSGRVPGVRQFVVGGFQVAEKINALAAYKRFPENRLRPGPVDVQGNIIVTGNGQHHPLDDHDNFARRVENYIVGRKPVYLENPREYNAAREESLDVLSRIFKRRGRRIFDVIGRYRKMNSDQVNDLLTWMREIKP